jgi:hypothetical protein
MDIEVEGVGKKWRWRRGLAAHTPQVALSRPRSAGRGDHGVESSDPCAVSIDTITPSFAAIGKETRSV